MDVETEGVLGFVDELVCSFKLVADVVWGGVCSLCMTLTNQHPWKGIWWDCVWMATGMSGFDTVMVNRCPFIWCEREQWVSPM